jgi:hypothetical protein
MAGIQDDRILGADVSLYEAGALDPNLDEAKGNLEIEFEAWGDDIGRLVMIPRDEFTKAAKNLLAYINKAVNNDHEKMTGAVVNDRQNAFRICWKTYVDKSRKAQPTAAQERAFLLAKSRRTDRIEYCKLEIAGKALETWAYTADANYGKPKPKFVIPPSCFQDGVIISMDPNATSTSQTLTEVLTRSSTPTKQELKVEGTGQPKLQLSDTNKEGTGQLKPPVSDEHQFNLDRLAIKDLEEGINVMVEHDKEESILRGFKKSNQVFEVYKEKVWKLVEDHTKIGTLGKNLKDLRLPIVIQQWVLGATWIDEYQKEILKRIRNFSKKMVPVVQDTVAKDRIQMKECRTVLNHIMNQHTVAGIEPRAKKSYSQVTMTSSTEDKPKGQV